jgi:hypothetical protein
MSYSTFDEYNTQFSGLKPYEIPGLKPYQITYLKNRENKITELRAERERKLNIKKTAYAHNIHLKYVMGNGSRQFKRSINSDTHNNINAWLFRFHNTKK